MSVTDIAAYNANWLKAWTDKDVERLCGFYAADCVYHDPQTAAGLKGNDALRAYLSGLFAATPPMKYTPDEVWP
ncbi:MAG: nuclear transport factor 2 family protein, partial [Phenylobacterium sp.]|nr:nuclear transport factor 2 family protein [Phenylobacterium sp.]